MLVFRALYSNVSLLNAGGIKLSLCLGDIRFGCCSTLKAIDGELQRIGIGLHRIVQQLLLGICAAQLEIIECEFCMQAEGHSFEIASRGLRLLTCRSNRPTHTPPKIDLIIEI